ncbi:MAG TPA: hypothetical protein VGV38_11475 [Pyrinomonadaceae bacterium]|nr:hypothetical protein [Pyrinomonadaceae bacterium]
MRLRLLACLYVLALAFIVVLADQSGGRRLFAFVHAVPLGDKCGHFVLAALFALALDAAFSRRTFGPSRVRFPAGSAVALAVITLEECSQVFFSSRSFDPLDLLADCLGVLCAVLLRETFRRRRARVGAHAAGAGPAARSLS